MPTTLMPNYARLPVTFVRGEGAWLWDTQGIRYLDALSGIAVCGLGHAHPAVTAAICEQANQLLHTSNLYGIAHQQTLADTLVRITGMDRAFFCNSGAEANEAALKIARLYGHNQGRERPAVIVTEGSFHGRTLATLTATGNPKVQAGFAPLLEGFVRVPYNDVNAMAEVAKQHPEVVAVLVEPITGEGGIVIPDDDYLANLRSLCDRHNWLLMLDEIQTGVGRTGQWCAYQHASILPDVLTLAKGLGNGVPIGACLARGKAAEVLKPGTHGSTFGGNPLVCRAARAVIETIEQDNLLQRAQELGQRFYQGFSKALDGVAGVQEIRVKGLMIGIELDRSSGQLMTKALFRQILINVAAERVVRLLPPLIISDAQADDIIATVSHLIVEFLNLPA
ncbi:MAG: aspartate aminotransferase family protein [Candidatus Parabeggiatoa sp. nov. 2]|nr:MAG: aspartate aminotransferase family protein [Beggiatoa sp. 4572_84]RKZ51376.1 MAG: aspartate aminotransferase family protein [Gammaproteobacteria bacterium]